jgi:hypothetical protein
MPKPTIANPNGLAVPLLASDILVCSPHALTVSVMRAVLTIRGAGASLFLHKGLPIRMITRSARF